MKPTITDRSVRDIEEYVRRAHAERAFYIAGLISTGIAAAGRGIGWAAARLQHEWAAYRPGGRFAAKRRLATR